MEAPKTRMNERSFPAHAVIATALLAVFVLRVFAQILQFYHPTSALPPFAAWESGALPYGLLVTAQAVIILVSAGLIAGLFKQRLRPNRKVGLVLLVLASFYLAGAIFRLLAGYTFLSDVPFFSDHLPAYFHIVLAGLVLTFGDFYRYGY
ncbi:MAG TPA: hypothetical protein VFK86_06890 [Bauldia sp.]|nr:hypothetical protein [Bauldia sp.]